MLKRLGIMLNWIGIAKRLGIILNWTGMALWFGLFVEILVAFPWTGMALWFGLFVEILVAFPWTGLKFGLLAICVGFTGLNLYKIYIKWVVERIYRRRRKEMLERARKHPIQTSGRPEGSTLYRLDRVLKLMDRCIDRLDKSKGREIQELYRKRFWRCSELYERIWFGANMNLFMEGNPHPEQIPLGTRVFALDVDSAINSVTEEGAIHSDSLNFFGHGVYEGRFTVPRRILKRSNFRKDWVDQSCPRIRLDNGQVIYGCECLWIPEDHEPIFIQGRRLVQVDIETYRKANPKKDIQK